ncbi:trypsin-like peptidase domain-containing protein [Lysobacter sp. SG-8]|uniref:Trypsin-like peptidase domain-containing protein n=1 Tax=Marilutibacter penaei TaxID=2759900 RepID=A0A7W3U2T4_9GAMM|nr:trypsin-like peptidase domain-containing protein [Lysobacter penaei]MBB1087590.1 trypsin-like peptidase domain-containing protein [Lysobacter penaei]
MEARTHNSHPTRLIASLAGGLLLSATLLPASAAETLLRIPGGDVVQLDAPRGAQQTLAATGQRLHPFATAEQRAKVPALKWTATTPRLDPRDAVELQRSLRLPAGNATGGDAPPFAEYMARADFPQAWDAIDRMDAVDPGEKDDVRMQDDDRMGTFDGAHYGYARFPGNYYTSRWKIAPWNKIGKLYFTKPDGGGSYCSASVASGNSILITAAHCVYTRGQGFNSNFVFVPADRYGVAPYGKFGWRQATVLSDWINVGSRKSDVAVIRLAGEQSTGKPVTDYVGWLGRSWNHGYEQYTYSIGYASNFSTQYTTVCAGTTYQSGNEGTDVLVQGCDMTYGSSGGPWLRNFTHNSHGGNHVNAVVSGPHIGDFGDSYVGPRFSSYNIVPLCNAIGC